MLDRNQPRTAYAASALGLGVFRSIDGGTTWVVTNVGLADTNVLSLAVDLSGTVYAGTRNHGVFALSAPGQEVLSSVVPAVISALGAASSFFKTSARLRHFADE